MVIKYDAATRRATHLESGLAVEFYRDGDYPQEREKHFRLIWKGQSLPFRAGYDFGEPTINRLYPTLDRMVQREKRLELNEQNSHVSSLPIDVARWPQMERAEFGEVFARVMLAVVAHLPGEKRRSVHFRPFFQLSQGHWSAQQ